MKRYLPFALFLALVALLGVGLTLNPREVPSPFIGKPAPDFDLAQLREPEKRLARRDLIGQVWMLNVWASWCTACRQEHPLLVDFAKRGIAPVYGLNYKDQRGDALRWLAQFGDPYTVSLSDPDGRTGIEYGVYGVPETFVVDRQGVVRYKHIGPITPELLRDKLVPLIKQLQAS